MAGRAAGVAALIVVAAPAAPAFALGGGGSGGFSDGGGLGGLGGGGGFIFGPIWFVVAIFILRLLMSMYRREAMQRRRDGRPPLTPAILLSQLVLWLLWPLDVFREARARRHRVRRVEVAAAEAAEEDPLFAPDTVRASADGLFRDVQDAWTADDRTALAALAGPTLVAEWERRLDDFAHRGWRNEVEIIGDLRIEYVGLVNREDDREDAVTVRIAAHVRDIVRDRRGQVVRRRGSASETHRVCEYWMLGKRDGRWIVVQIEQRREGLHVLHEPIVATPWGDDERLHREATVEQAEENRLAASDLAAIGPPEIDEDARLAALDLSLVDGRFAPDVLATEVRYAVTAWAQAIDGDRTAIDAVATPQALTELLYADDAAQRTRRVVRGLSVKAIRIAGLGADTTPAHMDVEIEATGIAYTEDRSTLIVVEGDRVRRRTVAQRWRLELTDAPTHPWRIVSVTAPVAS